MTFVFDSTFWEDFRAALSCMVRQPAAIVASVLPPALFLAFLWAIGLVRGPFWPTASIVLSVVNLPLVAIDRVDRVRRKRVTGNRTVILMNDDGITASTDWVRVTAKWDDLVKVRETKSFFFFYLSRRWAQMLPKRVIAAGDLAVLREMIATHRTPSRT